MIDIVAALESRIDIYKREIDRTRKQAFMDSEYGYEGSSQFNKGQQFVYESVVSDLEDLVTRIKSQCKDNEFNNSPCYGCDKDACYGCSNLYPSLNHFDED